MVSFRVLSRCIGIVLSFELRKSSNGDSVLFFCKKSVSSSMKIRCPGCKKQIKSAAVAGSEYFPFCSKRCKLVDLNAWFDSEYVITRQNGENKDE